LTWLLSGRPTGSTFDAFQFFSTLAIFYTFLRTDFFVGNVERRYQWLQLFEQGKFIVHDKASFAALPSSTHNHSHPEVRAEMAEFSCEE
jgi:hypothetical protein